MKKSLVALAALAAVGVASAQSTVTISGTYAFSYQKDLTAATANPVFAGSTSTAPTTGTLTAASAKGLAVTDATLKLAAVEDLGGGLKASFDYLLETAAQRGALVTRADSGVGLSGGFGSVALRNTRTSDLIATIGSSAISLPDGLYDSSNIVARSAVDVVSFSAPAFSGVTATLSFIEGNDGNINLPTTDKSAYVLGLSYANGPIGLAAAFKSANSPAATTKKSNVEFAASYDFGVAKVAYAFDGKSTTTGTYSDNANGVTVHVPMGAVSLGAGYYKRGNNKVTEMGATYAFSKRTTVSLSGGKQTADANGNQFRLRVGHTF